MSTTHQFKALLDAQYKWPAVFPFKFIVTKEQLPKFKELFAAYHLEFKSSGKGNYVSVSFSAEMHSSEAVLVIYEKAQTIPGLISL